MCLLDLSQCHRIVLLFYFASWWTRTDSMCLPKCQCDDDKLTTWCESANLDMIPIILNPRLQNFYLSNNRIGKIMNAFNVYKELVYLDLTDNQISKIDGKSFYFQKKLKVLHLNGNLINFLKNTSLVGLISLQVLRLDDNYLTEIPSYVFHNLTSLEILDLSKNRIALVDPLAFEGLHSLKRLILRDNKLTQIPSASFQRLINLQVLDLGSNNFNIIPGNAFFHLRRLKILNTDNCEIEKIQQGAFKNLDDLRVLQIQKNQLTQLPSESFIDMPILEELHLGQNKFKQLSALSFQGLVSLRVVVINGIDELASIEKGAFEGNNKLERIYITHNRNLATVDSEIFQSLENLRYVSLRGNRLVSVSEELLPWDKLEGFDLRDNPLLCNCSVTWLWDALRNLNLSVEGRVLCETPSHLQGVPLVDCSVDDLDCYQDARRQILTGSAVAVGIILLLATIAILLWYKQRIARKNFEKKLKHEQVNFQRPETPDERYASITRGITYKVSPITDL